MSREVHRWRSTWLGRLNRNVPLKCVTTETITALYSNCIKTSPITERWYQTEITWTEHCCLPTITRSYLPLSLLSFPLPFLPPAYLYHYFPLERFPCSSLILPLFFIFPLGFGSNIARIVIWDYPSCSTKKHELQGE